MENNLTEFDRSFNKHRKLLHEHLGIAEADTQDAAGSGHHYKDAPRDTHGRVDDANITYVTKEAKGEVIKIIATLRKHRSGEFTTAITKYEAIARLQEQLDALEQEIKQEGIREKIAALFGAKYEFCTRVIQTVNLTEIAITKQPEAAVTTKWAEVWKELSTRLTPELLEVGKALVKKHSTEQAPKPPSVKYTPAPVSEGLGDIWNSFLNKIKSWGKSYDSKLSSVEDKIKNL